jgi:hypothetical protein
MRWFGLKLRNTQLRSPRRATLASAWRRPSALGGIGAAVFVFEFEFRFGLLLLLELEFGFDLLLEFEFGFYFVGGVQGNRPTPLSAVLATKCRVECHGVAVVVDMWIVLPQPGHTENERVREGCDVECELFDVARDADCSCVEMGDGASRGVVAVGHYHGCGRGLQFVGHWSIFVEFFLNAIALTTPIYQSPLCHKPLSVPHIHISILQTRVFRLESLLHFWWFGGHYGGRRRGPQGHSWALPFSDCCIPTAATFHRLLLRQFQAEWPSCLHP